MLVNPGNAVFGEFAIRPHFVARVGDPDIEFVDFQGFAQKTTIDVHLVRRGRVVEHLNE